jgi:MOSC domain-containing protein YiiM
MTGGEIVSIHVTTEAAAPMVAVEQVRAVPGRGLEGDRYFTATGTYSPTPGPSREVTLIELEAIEALKRELDVVLEPCASRRNLVTRGVALNHLVDREFAVGPVRLRGLRLCEPCGHLERLTTRGVQAGLIHRGGLRAQILTEGIIRVGDAVQVD